MIRKMHSELPVFARRPHAKFLLAGKCGVMRLKSSPLFEIARVLVRLDHVAPELGGSLRRGRLTSSPPQFGQTKYICSAQLAQYVHS
jgi:hypothetical protein